MKKIHVVSAAICDFYEKPKKIFATEKGYGNYQGSWEFPGGKIEEGESKKEALNRELMEELGVKVDIGPLLGKIEYDYPEFHVEMDCFLCKLREGKIELKEASDGRWLNKAELFSVDWLPSDLPLIEKLQNLMKD